MVRTLYTLAFVAEAVSAFPFVAQQAGVDSSLFRNARRQQTTNGPGSAAACPYNPNHVAAAPITTEYPYNGAIGGLPGLAGGGYQVPAKGDTAHAFVAPGSTDIRGPCPGLNALANHNFIAHDGITTFDELVDAQQNVYNVGYALAVVLATAGIVTGDGDTVTEKLSIGCDATSRTSYESSLTGEEYGLDGHNRFEADASLSRDDFFTGDGDNFSLNTTLFGQMASTANNYFDLPGLAKYRYQRYNDSVANNPNFFFSPLALLLYGAASFLYELMPSGTTGYAPDLATISSFFGVKQNADGSFSKTSGERIPDGWVNRATPYTDTDVNVQIVSMYSEYPVMFGGNTGNVNSFNGLNTNGIENGQLTDATPQGVLCLIYQNIAGGFASGTESVFTPAVAAVEFAVTKLGPQYANLGCAIPLT